MYECTFFLSRYLSGTFADSYWMRRVRDEYQPARMLKLYKPDKRKHFIVAVEVSGFMGASGSLKKITCVHCKLLISNKSEPYRTSTTPGTSVKLCLCLYPVCIVLTISR